MKIIISPQLYRNALAAGVVKSKLDAKRKTGLHYDVITNFADGTFNAYMLGILGKFLSAIGYKADEVAEMQVKELFDVKED